MKIVSLIPSATEIVAALGRESDLVGVSHECDYPPGVRERAAVLVSSPASLPDGTQREIDDAVARALEESGTLYVIDEEKLRELAPDLIITQELCQVCAPSGNEVTRAIAELPDPPEVLYLTPSSFEEVFANVLDVGRAIGADDEARALVEACRARVAAVRERAAPLSRRTCLYLEWTDPVFLGGHWVHENIELAGGEDPLGPAGDSVRVTWDAVREADPEVLVVGPCGYHLDRAHEEAASLAQRPGWDGLRAVREDRVYVVDADSYFARPGPRIVDGLELLAHVLHPEVFEAPPLPDALRRLRVASGAAAADPTP